MKPWENNIRKLEPYTPGEQPNFPGMIKINTNENPYPPAPEVSKVIETFEWDRLRLYPDTNATPLVEELAKYHNRKPEELFVGVGSDDVLAMAFLTFFCSKKPILFADVTYSFYEVWANLYEIPYKCPTVDDKLRLNMSDYFVENGGVVLANPNAPTSIYEELEVIEEIIVHNQDVIVIVDEAYIDFGGTSAVELIDKYDNLLVVQTFSKSRSMAGARIGYAMGNSELIKALNVIKNSYNSYTMNMLSVEVGVASVKADEYFNDIRHTIIATREWTKQRLTEFGFLFPDSKTNFLFITHEQWKMEELFEYLKEKKIFVRHFKQERIRNYLRVSIGTRYEMERLIEEVEGFYESTNSGR